MHGQWHILDQAALSLQHLEHERSHTLPMLFPECVESMPLAVALETQHYSVGIVVYDRQRRAPDQRTGKRR